MSYHRKPRCCVAASTDPTPTGDSGEQKTKPTQHSVKEMRSLGLSPDFIVCRSTREIDIASREKISLFCNVPVEVRARRKILTALSVPDHHLSLSFASTHTHQHTHFSFVRPRTY